MSRTVEHNDKLHLLVVDEDTVISSVCCQIATSLGLVAETLPASHVRTHLRDRAVDILLVDWSTPAEEDLALLNEIKELHPSVGVVVMSAYASVSNAVEMMRAGATEYLPKPFIRGELVAVLERVIGSCEMQAANRRLRETLQPAQGLAGAVGRSPEMDKLHRFLPKVAQSSHPVLILGELGVGKEWVARTIHSNGPHADRPFITIDCSSPNPTLIASELFGHAKGRFSRANHSKEGLSPSPQTGTIFFDEISELPLDLQAELLRAMQEKEARARHPITVNSRLLAATHHDLPRMVEHGRFRKDLYQRLCVVNLRIPPLRERKQDIPLLISQFLGRIACEGGTRHTISDDALRTLLEYHWPGNVRELENSIVSACTLSTGSLVNLGDLPQQLQNFYFKNRRPPAVAGSCAFSGPQRRLARGGPDVVLPLAQLEKQAILKALGNSKVDKGLIARQLGIGRTTLYRKLKEYGIGEPARLTNNCR